LIFLLCDDFAVADHTAAFETIDIDLHLHNVNHMFTNSEPLLTDAVQLCLVESGRADVQCL